MGSLMYVMLGTRPDLAFSVLVISRYSSNPDASYWQAVKQVFWYIKGSLSSQLIFRGPLLPYTNTDWVEDYDTQRSTSGYVFNVGSGAISWFSK